MTENLDSILSGKGEAAPPPETSAAPAAPTDGPSRDDRGRFAPKTEGEVAPAPAAQPAPAAPPAPEPRTTATPVPSSVPQAALHAAREKTREKDAEIEGLRAQLTQLQRTVAGFPKPQAPPPPPPPDPFADPQAFQEFGIRQALTPLQEQMESRFDAISRMLAEQQHGSETVQAAYAEMAQAIGTDPAVQDDHKRIMASPNPYASLVSWHKRRQALSEIGEDPAAYKERLRADLLAELQANGGGQPAPAAQPGRTPAVMPSNLAGARNVGTRTGPDWSGPAPLQDIFDRGKKR